MGQISSIEEEKKGDILILRLQGRLDAMSSPETEKQVFQHIMGGEQKIIFELLRVDYLSSAGLRMMLSTAKKLKTEGGKLVLSSVPPSILDILKLSGFEHILTIAADVEEALMRFGEKD